MKAFVLDEGWKGMYVVFAENKENAVNYIMKHLSYLTFHKYIEDCVNFNAEEYILKNLNEVYINDGVVIRAAGELIE